MLTTMMKKMRRFGTSLVFGGSLLMVGASTDGCNEVMASFEQGFEIGQQLAEEFDSTAPGSSEEWYEDDSYYEEDDWGFDSFGDDFWG